jgi:hypothetical protein
MHNNTSLHLTSPNPIFHDSFESWNNDDSFATGPRNGLGHNAELQQIHNNTILPSQRIVAPPLETEYTNGRNSVGVDAQYLPQQNFPTNNTTLPITTMYRPSGRSEQTRAYTQTHNQQGSYAMLCSPEEMSTGMPTTPSLSFNTWRPTTCPTLPYGNGFSDTMCQEVCVWGCKKGWCY